MKDELYKIYLVIKRKRFLVGLLVFVIVLYSFLFFVQNLDGTAINPIYEFPKDTLVNDIADTTHIKETGNANGDLIGTYTLQTDKGFYKVGETIYVQMSFCKYRMVVSNTQWILLDGIVMSFLAKEDPFIIPACYNKVTIPTIKVTTEMLLGGNMHLQGYTSVKVNNFRTILVGYQTNTFFIIP